MSLPRNPGIFAVPRGPNLPCPECGRRGWIQRLAVWHGRDGCWSARRTCRSCRHTWTDVWVDREPDVD